ncbi:hypothetical protein QJS66_01850 [Kocuria rhizophila]|nr:hypothetical protein QJS66_01850 [Kocuria rhizophila]
MAWGEVPVADHGGVGLGRSWTRRGRREVRPAASGSGGGARLPLRRRRAR